MPEPNDDWWVACLCAQWCGVCRDWRAAFEAQAHAHPSLHFAWVDVEDDDAAMGDVDIETFPTLLIGRGTEALFFGPVQPSGAGLARIVETLHARPGPTPGLPAAAGPLLARLRPEVLPRSRV